MLLLPRMYHWGCPWQTSPRTDSTRFVTGKWKSGWSGWLVSEVPAAMPLGFWEDADESTDQSWKNSSTFARNSEWNLSLSSKNSGEFMSHQGLNLVILSPKVLNHTKWRWICYGSVPVSRIPLDTVRGKRKEQLCNPAHVNPWHFLHVWPGTNRFLSVSFGGFVTKREIKIIISAHGWLGASFSLLWVCIGPRPPKYFKLTLLEKGEKVRPLTLLCL